MESLKATFPTIIIQILVMFLLFQFYGCNSDKEKYQVDLSTKPKFDFSTPDKTIESYLNYSIWADTCLTNLNAEFFLSLKDLHYSVFYKLIRDSLTNDQLKMFVKYKESSVKRKKIEKVDIESDTRAIVLVNTGEFTYGGDKAPVLYKYTLTKENNDWLIKIVEKTCYVCDGTGKVEDFENYSLYRRSYKACESCKGDGWSDEINYGL